MISKLLLDSLRLSLQDQVDPFSHFKKNRPLDKQGLRHCAAASFHFETFSIPIDVRTVPNLERRLCDKFNVKARWQWFRRQLSPARFEQLYWNLTPFYGPFKYKCNKLIIHARTWMPNFIRVTTRCFEDLRPCGNLVWCINADYSYRKLRGVKIL